MNLLYHTAPPVLTPMPCPCLLNTKPKDKSPMLKKARARPPTLRQSAFCAMSPQPFFFPSLVLVPVPTVRESAEGRGVLVAYRVL